jgi:hypothetical protein
VIRHVVTWKLAATDDAARDFAASEIIEAFENMGDAIPEILETRVARNVNPLDINWDLVCITDFESLEALGVYQRHPAHAEAATVSRARVSDRSIIDFEV